MLGKFILFVFIGFISSFINDVRSEDICTYSSTKEYESCIKENKIKREPKWPLFIGDSHKYILRKSCKSFSNYCSEKGFFQLKSLTGKELIIGTGKAGFARWNKFKVKSSREIPSLNIVNWSKATKYWNSKHDFYNIKFLNNEFELENVYFGILNDPAIIWPPRLKGDIISEFLEKISGLKVNQKRSEESINNLILDRINSIEKRLIIVKSIIKDEQLDSIGCFEAKETKYPELVKNYRKLSKEIKPLRGKLDLPQSKKIKPICD